MEGISYGLCCMGDAAALCSCSPTSGSQTWPHVAQNQLKPGLWGPALPKSLCLNGMLKKGHCQVFFVSEIRSTMEGSAALWGWFACAGFQSLSPAQGTELAALSGMSLELWLVLGEKGHTEPFDPSAEQIPTFSSLPFDVPVLSFSSIQFPLLICNAAALNYTMSFLEMFN